MKKYMIMLSNEGEKVYFKEIDKENGAESAVKELTGFIRELGKKPGGKDWVKLPWWHKPELMPVNCMRQLVSINELAEKRGEWLLIGEDVAVKKEIIGSVMAEPFKTTYRGIKTPALGRFKWIDYATEEEKTSVEKSLAIIAKEKAYLEDMQKICVERRKNAVLEAEKQARQAKKEKLLAQKQALEAALAALDAEEV